MGSGAGGAQPGSRDEAAPGAGGEGLAGCGSAEPAAEPGHAGVAARGKKAAGAGLTVRGGLRPKRTAPRAKDWTPAMAERFVETLADTCNVTLAARSIERSVTNVYRQRGRDANFRRQWHEALTIGYSRLEMMLLERALHGVEKIVVLKDGGQSVMREYCDRTALALLRMHRDAVEKYEAPIAEQEYVEARDRIMARIERIRARKGVRVETKSMARFGLLLRRISPASGRRA